jgi:hypothetical protein
MKRTLPALTALATAAALATFACNSDDKALKPDQKPPTSGVPSTPPDPDAPGKKEVQTPLAAETAPAESPRLADLPPLKDLQAKIPGFFQNNVGRRIYVQVDKALYKPGETVWIKSWDLQARDLKGPANIQGVRYELVSPKGAVVLKKRVQVQNGTATNDFEIPEGVQGGEYQIRAIADDGVKVERPIIVSTYEPPRVKKKLEFVRKAYGAGDEVTATLEVKRPTGEPMANKTVTAVIRLDDAELPRVNVTTNAEGGALVKFTLPANIERGDGLLTVLVEDGGVTESVSKSVPILLKKLQFSFYPEGGQIVAGQAGRVYFEAKNPIGKPADVEGKIVDDHGNAVGTFTSYHDGLGRFELTPNTGRTYHAEITKPVGISEHFALPMAAEDGCNLRSYDDFDSQDAALRVAVRCATPRKVVVVGMVRENLLDAAAVDVKANEPAIVYLKSADAALAKAQGIARVTLFDEKLVPLAERLVYRNRRQSLQVKVKPDQETYTPREQVALKIETLDADGKPMPAEVALSVVDDTVVSFADDKQGHMLSKLFLEPEVPGKVEEPNVYFDLTEKKSATAMDLLMGTRGWRKFEWAPVINPPPPMATGMAEGGAIGGLGMRGFGRGGGGKGRGAAPGGAVRIAEEALDDGMLAEAEMAPPPVAMPAPPPKAAKRPAPEPQAFPAMAAAAGPAPAAPPPPPPADAPAQPMRDEKRAEAKAEMAAAKPMPMERARRAAAPAAERAQNIAGDDAFDIAPAKDAVAGRADKADRDWGGEMAKKKMAAADEEMADNEDYVLAPVRVFPAPTYDGAYDGPRTDFRETIHWQPSVRTGKDGQATITFYLSDAITSFRVFAEGTGGGLAGRHEEVIQSALPFSMSVKLPVEVSAGDKLRLPLTLTNEQDKSLPVSLTASFGDLLKLDGSAGLKGPALAAKARESIFYPVTVTGLSGKSKVSFSADAGGLKDEFIRELNVVPLGFPQEQARAGTLTDRVTTTFDLGEAMSGTTQATIKLYPSPVATLTSGLDGLLREPSGCFEQTSSTNYPNVMVLQYLKSADVVDPALTQRAGGLIERGYQKLVGFETPKKGYEWFGGAPPHEALTAYGVLEFVDMKRIYGGVDDEMLARTVTWLKSRRNGKGGFERDGQALDNFGRASPEVTDAYILYAVSEAGMIDQFPEELAAQARRAAETKDPYLLALAANTLLNAPAKVAEGQAATLRLAGMQKPDGVFGGADHSITRSGGSNLDIETTALATLAMLKAKNSPDSVRRGVDWLNKNRGGFGEWGATQATVLALKASTEYALASRQTQSSGSVVLLVNGRKVGDMPYEAGRRDALVFDNLGAHFQPGANTIELVHTGRDSLPYSMAVEYRSLKPATDPNVVVELATKLDKSTVRMGENVRLTATLKNRTRDGQPMTIARVGLPGGLNFQTWQLKELKEKGIVDQWETKAREVILYFREMKPDQVREIPLDLVATVPGDYTGPASSAYLYYTDDRKFWSDALKASVTE